MRTHAPRIRRQPPIAHPVFPIAKKWGGHRKEVLAELRWPPSKEDRFVPPQDGGYNSNRLKTRTPGTDFPDSCPEVVDVQPLSWPTSMLSHPNPALDPPEITGPSRALGGFSPFMRHSLISISEIANQESSESRKEWDMLEAGDARRRSS
jgi:hypothetical protein